ncbi:MAG: (4Fe-4S)-binding protein [Candidatus Melainabacteria bacterium RIFOXYA12_FULL_32_12]|nr:MAG: (4Fe-4S)-binding protein [Candidatus Melainabacteria bacterium RIFOXYA12_FULL_32_12]
MKELVVISGKGGTGKTSIVAAFSSLAENKVIVDCDVDAADLHLILNPKIELKTEFYSGKSAQIKSEFCTKCKKCIELCKFGAISKDFIIDEIKCEGCGVCYNFCSYHAIKFETKQSGEWYESNTRFGKLIHAKLGAAEENSGKLVTAIRNHARLVASKNKNGLILVDGSPGIGCPVIASISGANQVVIVTEPTLSGIHDLERVYKLTQHFRVPACVCINKYDINFELSLQIEKLCQENKIELLGKVPYSNDFTNAQIKGLSITEYTDNEVTATIKTIWENIYSKLMERKNV